MKRIMIIMMALSYVAGVLAQDSYYYYNGGREPLNIDKSKVVTISPKGQIPQLPTGSVTLSISVSDDMSNIIVCCVKQGVNIANLRRQIKASSSNVSLQNCYKDADGLELRPTGYIYVELKSASDVNLLYSVAAENECSVIKQNAFMPLWYTLRINYNSDLDPVDVANEIYETGNFSSSSPDFHYDALEISYDPLIDQQWGLCNTNYEGIDISVSEAWGYATGRGIKIAIIDEGIELTHCDLAPNIYYKSYDASTGKSPSRVYGHIGHGTHCAGIAAAVRNNNILGVGVAPDASLMSVSMNFNRSQGASQVADAINWAWQNGADILSCSWRCIKDNIVISALDNALSNGREGRGCIIVKSAGNEGEYSGRITFPGDYSPDILAVGNITENGIINESSSYGDNMLVCAPGTNIGSTILNNGFGEKNGTSMACPHVSGVIALMLERNPFLTSLQIRRILGNNAKKVGHMAYDTIKAFGSWNERYGYGLVDAYNSVKNTPIR